MAEPFYGEIKIYGCTFAPEGWAFCDGQLIDIAQNTALFSILGTIYGGDGRVTFALPNLKGKAPMHWGSGPGLTQKYLGEYGGAETVVLSTSHMPAHTHEVNLISKRSTDFKPQNDYFLAGARGAAIYAEVGDSPTLTPMSSDTLQNSGGSQAHNNMQPSLSMNFCIAMAGIYPPRN
jgi:microcystin-dependent protein